MYRTSGQNIQILVFLKFFSELCYNGSMTEEYTGPLCCAGCTCTTSHSSKPPATTIDLEEPEEK